MRADVAANAQDFPVKEAARTTNAVGGEALSAHL